MFRKPLLFLFLFMIRNVQLCIIRILFCFLDSVNMIHLFRGGVRVSLISLNSFVKITGSFEFILNVNRQM